MIERYGENIEYDRLAAQAQLQWEQEHSTEDKEEFIRNAVSRTVATSFIELLVTIAREITRDEEEFASMEPSRDGMIYRLFSIDVAIEGREHGSRFIAQVVPAKTENHP